MRSSIIESTCVFGSVARSNSDQLSDKDVLIISNCRERRLELSRQWKSQGWSVSSYTPSRFMALVAAGSLFVQHLKYEGLIIADRNSWLRTTLDFAKPRRSYITDAKRSVLLTLPVERFSQDIPLGDLGLVPDLSYVGFRNFGINYLASNGVLEFDFKNIAHRVGREFSLSTKAIDMLVELRLGKASYRKGEIHSGLQASIGELRRVLERVFSFRPLVSIESDSPVRNLGSGYATLRDFEAAIIARVGGFPSESYLRGAGIEKSWRLVTSPSEYSWSVRNFTGTEKLPPSVSCFQTPNTLDHQGFILSDKVKLMKSVASMSVGNG